MRPTARKETIMTKREFLNAVIALNDEVTTEFAKAEIEKMDIRNANRKDRPSKRTIENEPIKAKIAEVLTDTPKTASMIAEEVGISVQKASALLRQMEVTVSEVKVPKKGKQKGYAL